MAILVERHIITKDHVNWSEIDKAAWYSKNIWNSANYILRQHFIHVGEFLTANQLYHQFRVNYPQDYESLPRKVSQLVIQQVHQAWIDWFRALDSYKLNPSAFAGRPRMPKYKHKERGRNRLRYNNQAFSKKKLKNGIIKPSQLTLEVKTHISPNLIQEVHITPQTGCYVIQVIYEAKPANPIGGEYVAGIDIGLDNLAAIATNKPGTKPILVNGRPLKSINQGYNKQIAKLKSQLPIECWTSRRIQHLSHKRSNRIRDYLHKASRWIINWLAEQQIGTLVIGKSDGWKQNIKIGRRNNQQFVSIPHAHFIDMLTYKAELAGIRVILTEESYTSKCSLLDNEPLQKHPQYMGKRVKRGLFLASDGRFINADINGAGNIIRKVIPNAFANGIEAFVVMPVRINPCTD